MTFEEYQTRCRRITEEQRSFIRAKCQWEHCTWLAVARDWPEMFTVADMPPPTPLESATAMEEALEKRLGSAS